MVKEQARQIANQDITVLLLGESGTGKELFARAIHHESLRKKEIFQPINCGAIPDSLIESELFGYEKGAFTGANPKGKIGKFERANGGTVFLDEIGTSSYAGKTPQSATGKRNISGRWGGPSKNRCKNNCCYK